MSLIDTHCHLDSAKLAPREEEVLANARAAGVSHLITIGCAKDVSSARSALSVARRHPDWISATVGVHPHDASHFNAEVSATIDEVGREEEIVAIGEMGLDYYYDTAPREEQREAFRRQIAIARRLKKPIIVHTRDAAEETLTILREENARDVGGIIHCFSEDASFAKRALDLGFVSSFSGIVTFKSARAIQDAAKQQPRDAILVETDAPYLAPVPFRGKTNEPAFVAHTAKFIAELRGETLEELADMTTRNARRIFRLERSPA